MITSFILNDHEIEVSKNGNISSQRDRARIIEGGEERLEKEHSSMIATFDIKDSVSNRFLVSVFGDLQLKLPDLRALTKIFAFLIGTISPREVYRRRLTCYFWMDKNINQIIYALIQNKLTAVCKEVGKIKITVTLKDIFDKASMENFKNFCYYQFVKIRMNKIMVMNQKLLKKQNRERSYKERYKQECYRIAAEQNKAKGKESNKSDKREETLCSQQNSICFNGEGEDMQFVLYEDAL